LGTIKWDFRPLPEFIEGGDSGQSRTPFHDEAERDSEMIPNGIPG
jgi:hypothetical protein